MKRRRAVPERADRIPKPIAPNPWRRGRRRSGVHLTGAAQSNGTQAGSAQNGGAQARGAQDNGSAQSSGESKQNIRGDAHGGLGDSQRAVAESRRDGTSTGHVTGLFSDRASAERACHSLAERGYRQDAIKLLISDQTCSRQFRDFTFDRDALRPIDPEPYRNAPHDAASDPIRDSHRKGAVASHRPRTCPAMLAVAVCADPDFPAGRLTEGSLADALAGAGLSNERMAEYEAALRAGAVLLRVIARSLNDARLIEIEWRRSYRAEKVHS